MSTQSFKHKDIFNHKLYISPLTCSYLCQSPEKDKSETDDNSDSSPMHSNEPSSPFSTEKSKSEACLTTELLNLLDECSPTKPREPTFKEEKETSTTYLTERNYLLEEYLSKENKENRNTSNILAIVPKKLTFTPIESEIQGKTLKPSFYKSKKGSKHFVERKGDWECPSCKNMNFSFRKKCNRCKCDKKQCEKQYNILTNNLLSMLKESK